MLDLLSGRIDSLLFTDIDFHIYMAARWSVTAENKRRYIILLRLNDGNGRGQMSASTE